MKTSTTTDAAGPVRENERHTSGPMSTAERVLALGGLWWAVLFVTTFALAGEEPPSNAPIGEIRDYFAAFPGSATVAYGLAGIGLVCYLAMFALRLIGSTQRSLGTVAITGAAFFVMLQAAGDVAFLSLTYGPSSALGTEQARTMLQLHETSHTLQPYSMAVFVVCAGLVALQTRIFAHWLGWAGIVIGSFLLVVGTGGLAGSAEFAHDTEAAMASFVLFIAWVGATSVSLALNGKLRRTT